MFGYILPVRQELKVKELDAFKSCYCGLCHAMGKNYGFASRFLLNYDFVFLTMLLWSPDTPLETVGKRCAACPFKKKACCVENPALRRAAGMSIILLWWKLMDGIEDEGVFKSFLYRVLSLFLKRAYRKAAAELPEFDIAVKSGVETLRELERQKCSSLDQSADCFAKILKAAAAGQPESKERILEEVFYHTGRWIYIIDACDDLEEDMKKGNYNPVAVRFGASGVLDNDMKSRMETTLLHSRNLAGNAFELLDETVWSGVIRNIIFLGMPAVCASVLNGKWRRRRASVPK